MTIVDRRFSVAEGTAVKAPCRAATTANITLGGLQTIDGVALAENDRVLVKNQSTGYQNGIYSASTGNWTRTRDFDGAFDIVTGTRVYVTAGTVNALFEYAVSTTGAITIDSTSIAFVSLGQASAAASAAAAAASAAASALILATVSGQVEYETRAAAIAASTPLAAGSISITRYATGSAVSYSTYVPGTVAGPMAFLDAAGHYWELDYSGGTVNALWFGAVGNGVADDTVALQAAITAGQTAGSVVYIPPGTYKITSSLLITSRLTMRGVGYQGDKAGGFNGSGISQTTGFLASTIVAPATVSAIVATTDYAVQISDLEIVYAAGANAGITGITIQSVTGATHGNSQSIVERVLISGADYGMDLENCLTFTICNNQILYCITGNLICNNPHFANFQQASVYGNEFWGADNVGFQFHIQVKAGGDIRIENNKFNGGNASSGVALFGQASGVQNLEPVIITGNSFEGQQNGLLWNTANANMSSTQVVVTGNQFWCGDHAILVNANGGTPATPWIIGLVITGNMLVINGGAGVGPIVSLDGVDSAILSGNAFLLTSGTGTAFGVGSNNAAGRVVQHGNVFGSGVTKSSATTPAVPASNVSASNTYPVQVQVLVFGGTGVTSAAVNGSTIWTQSSAPVACLSVMLNPGDSLSVIYSSAPSWTWRAISP